MKVRTKRIIAFAICSAAMELGLLSMLWMTGNPVFTGITTFFDLLVLYLVVTVGWNLALSGFKACRVLVRRHDLQVGVNK